MSGISYLRTVVVGLGFTGPTGAGNGMTRGVETAATVVALTDVRTGSTEP